MARPVLTDEAVERSTYVITLTFADAADDAVTPSAVTWTLTDGAGNVINARTNVTATPGPTVVIVLSGADLALQLGETGDGTYKRLLTVQATYSSTEGSGLPLKEEHLFALRPLVAVT